MTNKTTPPKAKASSWKHSTFESEHPSYGHVQFSRVTGGNPRLFGSAVRNHYNFIRLTVRQAELEHSLHRDRTFSHMTPIIEVDMSAAQFAELLTSMNVGSGVPCTIRRANGENIEDPPDIETEAERIRSSFTSDLGDMTAKMTEYRTRIEELCKKMPEKSRTEIRIALDVITGQLASNVPFIAEQFNEAAERIVTSAKAEVEAFTMHAITTAGLTAIAESSGLLPPAPKRPEPKRPRSPRPELAAVAHEQKDITEELNAIRDGDTDMSTKIERWFMEGMRAAEDGLPSGSDGGCPYIGDSELACHWWTRGYAHSSRLLRALELEAGGADRADGKG